MRKSSGCGPEGREFESRRARHSKREVPLFLPPRDSNRDSNGDPPAIVYRFLDEDGRLLYVGVTIVGPRRWGEHAVMQPWWRLVSTVKVAHFDTYSEAFAAEHRAIVTEGPLYNIAFRASGKVRRAPARKRRPGTGSVFQNPDGRWVAQMTTGPRGHRKLYRQNVATKDLADAALQEMLARVAAGKTPRDPQRAPKVAA